MRNTKNSTTAKKARTSRSEMETSTHVGRTSKTSSKHGSRAKNCK